MKMSDEKGSLHTKLFSNHLLCECCFWLHFIVTFKCARRRHVLHVCTWQHVEIDTYICNSSYALRKYILTTFDFDIYQPQFSYIPLSSIQHSKNYLLLLIALSVLARFRNYTFLRDNKQHFFFEESRQIND